MCTVYTVIAVNTSEMASIQVNPNRGKTSHHYFLILDYSRDRNQTKLTPLGCVVAIEHFEHLFPCNARIVRLLRRWPSAVMLFLASFVPVSGDPVDWVSFTGTVLWVSTSSRVSKEITLLYVNIAVMWPCVWYPVSHWIKSWNNNVLFLNLFISVWSYVFY